jgi:hypothetical protein
MTPEVVSLKTAETASATRITDMAELGDINQDRNFSITIATGCHAEIQTIMYVLSTVALS